MLYNAIYDVISAPLSAVWSPSDFESVDEWRMLGMNSIRVLFSFVYGPCNAAYRGKAVSVVFTHTFSKGYMCLN